MNRIHIFVAVALCFVATAVTAHPTIENMPAAQEVSKSKVEIPAPAYGTEDNVTIQGSVGKLQAWIRKPAGLKEGQRVPMVVMMHGFTGDCNVTKFILIADSLAKHGIASIRFYFNGHGTSDGDFKNMTVLNEIDDAKAVIAYAKALPYVKNISLLGHSQGGVVASIVAGQLGKKEIKNVVLMAPAAALREDAIRGNTQGATYNPASPPAEGVPLRDGLVLGAEYIKTAQSLRIYETAAQYNGTAMIIHGDADRIVPYTYGERYHYIWKKSKLVILPGEDHVFSVNVQKAAECASNFLIQRLHRK